MSDKHAWKILRDDRWISRAKGESTPLRARLEERFSPELAEFLEEKIVLAAEYYETMIDDTEQEHWPTIATLAKRLRREIEKTRRFKIYTRRNSPEFLSQLQITEERAKRDMEARPARKRFKKRDRAANMALTIARFLDGQGVTHKHDLIFALEVIFEALDLPCNNIERRLIPKTLRELQARKELAHALNPGR